MNNIACFNYFLPNCHKVSINAKNKYQNLSQLKVDTVSFSGKTLSEKEKGYNPEWIDDKKVSAIIKKAFSDNAKLTSKEIQEVLSYFNYEIVNSNGDSHFKHKYLNAYSIFTMKAGKKEVAISNANNIRNAVKMLNRTSGELLIDDQISSSERIEAFNKSVQDCPQEYKNPYRLKLEEYQRQQQELQKVPTKDESGNIQQKENNEKNCKKYVEQVKKIITDEYLATVEICIECLEEECQDSQNKADLERYKSELAEKKALIEQILKNLDYADGDNMESIAAKADSAVEEAKALSKEAEDINDETMRVRVKNQPTESEAVSNIEQEKEETLENLDYIKQAYSEIQTLFLHVKKLNKKYKNSDLIDTLAEIQKRFNIEIKRKAGNIFQLCNSYSFEELNEQADVMGKYLQKAKEFVKAADLLVNADEERQKRGFIQLANLSKVPVNNVNEVSSNEVDLVDAPISEIIPDTSLEVVEQASKEKPQVALSDYSQKIFNQISRNMQEFFLPDCARDICDLLIENIGVENINQLETMDETDFVEFIARSMYQATKTPQYKTNIRAMNMALLNELSLCSNEDNQEIYSLSSKEIAKLLKGLNEGQKEFLFLTQDNKNIGLTLSSPLDEEDVLKCYNEFKAPLDGQEIDELIKTLKKYTPAISSSRLSQYLSQQGKYLTLLNDEYVSNELKTKLLKLVYDDFDKINGTNYTYEMNIKLNAERVDKEIDSLVNEVDWDNL